MFTSVGSSLSVQAVCFVEIWNAQRASKAIERGDDPAACQIAFADISQSIGRVAISSVDSQASCSFHVPGLST